MKTKILLSLVAVLVVAGGVAAMSAFEAHVINVTAKIENALNVTSEEIAFGTVFPQEYLEKLLTIVLSPSFMEETNADDVDYKIVQKPKPETELLCPYLSKLDDKNPDNDGEMTAPHISQCSDGKDNDGDGKTDYPADLECASAYDNDEAIAGNQYPEVPGKLAKSEGDIKDDWTIDLLVPCFEGMCEQGYEGPTLPKELEGKAFGCDLWVEVTGISRVGI